MTANKLLTAREEDEMSEQRYQFENNDSAIVVEVQHQMAVEQGDIVEVESDDEELGASSIPGSEIIQICKLEMVCISESDVGISLNLSCLLCKFGASEGNGKCETNNVGWLLESYITDVTIESQYVTHLIVHTSHFAQEMACATGMHYEQVYCT